MKRYVPLWTALLGIMALPSCGSLTNGNGQLPGVTQVPLASLGKLTFAVGTAKLQDGSTGLNLVAYARKSDGSTPYLVDTPSIAGPAGFVVPSSTMSADGNGGSGSDAGGATINGTVQSSASPPPGGTTFGPEGGVYGGGLGPFNSTANGNSNYYPGQASPGGPNPTFLMPFYETNSGNNTPTDPRAFIVGPPAKGIPQFTNVSYPPSYAGFLPGFTAFKATPVAGTYTLNVTVPAANAQGTKLTATASLASVTALPAIAAPTLAQDGKGGGTISVTIPAGVTETLIFVHDITSKAYYTVGPIAGTGAQTATLPDNLGPCSDTGGCNAPTIAFGKTPGTGDAYELTAIGFDYPDFEAIPPVSNSQTPTVTGAGGQADLTISPATEVAAY